MNNSVFTGYNDNNNENNLQSDLQSVIYAVNKWYISIRSRTSEATARQKWRTELKTKTCVNAHVYNWTRARSSTGLK